MDPAHGTERLADASFLEEILRGRRTIVLTFDDPEPARHLALRLGPVVSVVEGVAAPAVPGASADAVVALGGFQAPEGVDRLIAEARRLLAPGGLFAVSWVDTARASLEAAPASAQPGGPPPMAAAEATRRLGAAFGRAVVVARQPYLGFQYVSGIDADGALTLDRSLVSGESEAPTGYIALACDKALPLGDALIQVPYDRVVARVAEWIRGSGAGAGHRQTAVPRSRDGAEETERLRTELVAVRDRAQSAVEEADRARGEVRAAKERASLLDAEVVKLRGRVRGTPEPDLEKQKMELAERTRERDAARKDAEGAAAEAARALEAAANFEREVDFLQERVVALDREANTLRAEKAKVDEDYSARLRDALSEAKNAQSEVERARAALAEAVAREKTLKAELEAARNNATRPDDSAILRSEVAEAAKRARDFEERFRDATAKLAAANQKASDLETAKAAAERAAEDAWKRLREAQAASAPAPSAAAGQQEPDRVPAMDLAASQRALAEAIARAETAERERRILEESRLVSPVSAASPAEPDASLREELQTVRKRADEAEARAASFERAADEARLRLENAAPPVDAEGLRSLLHQRETALNEARAQAGTAEGRAARFTAEAAEALERSKKSEEALEEREVELKRALGALEGVELREQRDRELLAELKGEIARLTEVNAAIRDDLARKQASAESGPDGQALIAERDQAVQAAGMAQAESARAHAEADALRERLDHNASELQALQKEKSRLEDQTGERERRIAELEAGLLQLRAAGDSNSEMERRSVAMAQKLANLEAELERAQADVKQATAEARKYRALAEAIEPPADRTGGRT